MIYYKRHLGDYSRDAGHLSLLEHGVYSKLLDLYYIREAPIPCDTAARLVGARTPAEKAAVTTVLREFFEQDGSVWRHKRCDEEIAAYHVKAERNRQVGGMGGRPKKRGTQTVTEQEPKGNPDGFQTEPRDNPIHNPLAIREEVRAAEAASVATPADPRKALWDLGVQILGKNSRGLIGQAIARTSEDRVAEVLSQMALRIPAEPKAYFVKATTPKERGFVC